MKSLKLIPLAALAALAAGSLPAQTLTNPDFENEDLSDNDGNGYGPLSSWIRSGGNIGVNSSSQPFMNGQTAPGGSYAAFCQGGGTISQPVSGFDPARLYSLSYFVSERGSAGDTATSTSVSLDGGTTSHAQPGSIVRTDKFRRILSGPLAVSGASSTLQINATGVNGDNTLLIDAVSLSRAVPRVPDNGFENPVQPGTGFEGFKLAYGGGGGTLAGSLWTFTDLGGMMRNGSSYNSTPDDYAPEGSQAALLIGTHEFSTTVSGFEAGAAYSLSFAAKGRGGIYGPNVLQIELGGVILNVSGSATVTPSQDGWTTHTTDPFIPGAGSFTLKVKGLTGGDKSSFIDDIRFNFVAEPVGPDLTPPTIVTRNPADNTTGILVNSNLVATFSEPVTAGTGNIILFNLTENTTLATIAATDGSQVSISGNTLTLNPTSNLPYGKEIAVRMQANTVADAAANPFAGYSDDSWSFTTAPQDTTAPTLATLSPSDDATRVSPLINLVATFSETIAVGTGNILLKNLTKGTQTTIAVTDGSQVSVSGSELTINPIGNFLSGGMNYAVRIPSGAIVDQADVPNAFTGVNDDTTWNFTTTPFQVNNFANGTDAATGISPGFTYSHLVDVQKDADTAVINGVAFNNTGAYTLTGTAANFPGNPLNGGAAGSGMAVLLDNFNYGGTAPVLTLSGLTPGQSYKLRLYVSGWAGSPETFTFDDTTPATVVSGVDRGAWQAAPSSFDYTYTLGAGDTTLEVTIADGGSGSFHWFGFSNQVIPATFDLAAVSPADNATGVDVRSNLVASFNQDITAGTGNITLRDVTDNTTIATIAATDASQVNISGNTLTLNPSSDLPIGKEIAVWMDPSTVLKLDDSPYAGFNDDRWTFTTVAPFDDSTWIADAGGNWSDTAKWSGNIVANGTNSNATLGDFITAARTITVDGARTIGNLFAADASHDYALDGNTLTLDRSSGMPTVDVVSGRTLTVFNEIAGTDGLQKTGAGTLVLIGPSTYTGGTTLSAGALQVLLPTSAGSGPITLTGNASISSGYYNFNSGSPTCSIVNDLAIGANTCTVTNDSTAYWLGVEGVVSGSGTLTAASINCNTTLSNNANTFTGTISLGNNHRLYLNSIGDGSSVELNNATLQVQSSAASPVIFNTRFINLNGTGPGTIRNDSANALTITPALVAAAGDKTLTLGGASTANNTFAGAISDAAGGGVISMSKTGSGTWILGGANDYTGTTSVSGGTLIVNGNQTNATGEVNVSATLGGTGTLGGNTTIADGGNLTFNLSTAPGSHNKLDITTDKSLAFSGSSTLVITSSGGASIGDYTLVTAAGGITGSAPALILPQDWTATAEIVGNNLILHLTAVPMSPFQGWATGGETFAGDANGDGVADGLAWFLGAASPSTNAQSKMPVPTKVVGFLTLTFDRVYPYLPAKLYLQFGNNLSDWTELLIPDTSTADVGGTGVEVDVVFGTPDQVTVKIPTTYQSASGGLFARLRASDN